MDILLDTHVFLWWDANDPQLALDLKQRIADPTNRIYVSAASVWEIAIKRQIGKLRFSGSPARSIQANGFDPLPISAADAERARSLDWAHRDPFDRMLVAQCLNANCALATADLAMRAISEVPVLWAR